MTDTAFYVELPADKEGNTSQKRAVVEACYYPSGTDLDPMMNPDRPVLLPVAPPEIVRRHGPHWYADAYGGWAEVDGPARLLTDEEWQTLVAGPHRTVVGGRPCGG